MIPEAMLRPVLIAGVLLAIMSVVDTLSYGVRTAGVIKKRLAISLSLFNMLVIVSRLSNMFMAPVLGNFPDKVFKQVYTAGEVLIALRIDLCFVIGGVLLGALLTPWFVNVTSRGIEILEEKGSLPPTFWYGMKRIWRLPAFASFPSFGSLREYLNFRDIPTGFLLFNILVTCFYSIGVMSTILAASWDHSLAVTTAMLSGIVNGIATMLLFAIVDPPAAVLIDGCISGKRPESHAKTMNALLVITRLAGCVLAVLMLPMMASYVMTVSGWVDNYFGAEKSTVVLDRMVAQDGSLSREFKVEQQGDELLFTLLIRNGGRESVEFTYSSGAKFDFTAVINDSVVWQNNANLRFTQAFITESLAAGESIEFSGRCPAQLIAVDAGKERIIEYTAHHLVDGNPVRLLIQADSEGPAP